MENRWARSPLDQLCMYVAPAELLNCTRGRAQTAACTEMCTEMYTEMCTIIARIRRLYEPLPLFLQLNYGKEILEAEGRRTGGAEANHTL